MEILQRTTEKHVLRIKPYPHLKRWWSNELTEKCKVKNRASAEKYRWRGTPDHPAHPEYRKRTKELARAINEAKAEHWRE